MAGAAAAAGRRRSVVWLTVSLWVALASSSASPVATAVEREASVPVVIHTWGWTEAAEAGWAALNKEGAEQPALDAVEAAGSTCERLQCGGTVGFGGSPDENGETTLDALIIDGTSLNMGAVASLRSLPSALSSARLVLSHSSHTLLAGSQASDFAVAMGAGPRQGDLSTEESRREWREWREGGCGCGPYKPAVKCEEHLSLESFGLHADEGNHDTIAIAAIDAHGNVAAGATTNGLRHKIPGRVGDSPIPGAGAYADSEVGACGATGDGDIMLRFLPCYQVVESMRLGLSPLLASQDALRRIRRRFPLFVGAVFALHRSGEHAGAAVGWTFGYTVVSGETGGVARVYRVEAMEGEEEGGRVM
eukprot:jgi/Chlat1/8654/Chrsp87S00663